MDEATILTQKLAMQRGTLPTICERPEWYRGKAICCGAMESLLKENANASTS